VSRRCSWVRAAVLCCAWFAAHVPITRAQCILPGAPGWGSEDETFNAIFTQNGPGWTGGDGTYSIPLPDGRVSWMFSDSYIGTVDPLTRLRSNPIFTAHNAVTVQDPKSGTLSTINPTPGSYFNTTSPKWFWVGDGLVVQRSPGVDAVGMFLLEWEPVGTSFQFIGNSIAVLSLPTLSLEKIIPLTLPNYTIEWGARIMRDGSYLYIYGVEDLGINGKFAHVARTTLQQALNPAGWTFWNSSAWVVGQSNSVRILADTISNEYTVDKVHTGGGPIYLMVAMDTSPFFTTWTDIVTYYSCTPQGPWTTRTVVYKTPETGQSGGQYGRLFTYDPRAHPEFNANGEILISYNVNDTDYRDLVHADDYRPKFIRVAIPGLQ
jgi:uncharacterized protein DUF5005